MLNDNQLELKLGHAFYINKKNKIRIKFKIRTVSK